MNTNTEQWGNIELPGLSDEELFKKNWNMVRNIDELVKTENWKKNHDKGILDRYNTTWLQNTSLSNKIKRSDSNFIKSWEEGMKKRNSDPKFLEILNKNGKKKSKPLVTPDGVFSSRREAAKHYNHVDSWVGSQIQKNPLEWYYISKEEYILLTGKEI